jgi:ferritin-like metal-binding protein YciE
MVSSRRPKKWRTRSTTSRCLTPRSSGGAQAIQHYEISRYGTLIAWAQELDRDNLVALLNANLKEEKAAGKKLSELCRG